MKVLLYSEGEKVIGKSGLGKAIKHQQMALKSAKIDYTLDLKDDYDILHINTYFPVSYEVAKKAKKKGKKIVYHAHSTEEDYKDGFLLSKQTAPLFKKWLIKCYSLGDIIVTPTPYSKRLLDSYGMNRKIYAISNGIELDKFAYNKENGLKFRNKYGYTNKDKVIIGIGLYIERKGIVDFVELAKELPQYKFIWFGYSPLSASTKAVRDAVNTKLPNLIFAGYVESSMISCAMSGCDLYLFPTFEETEGIPVIEACASKCKTLIRDIPVFDDWLKDGVNVYKAKNKKEFKDKIIKIVENKLPDLTEEAYKVAYDRRIEVIGQELKKVYEEVLKMDDN
ncbi:MAG: glycosyltransferase [Bacilli bacterium]|nr:glycosyltransferase [Bacilli bacterium]